MDFVFFKSEAFRRYCDAGYRHFGGLDGDGACCGVAALDGRCGYDCGSVGYCGNESFIVNGRGLCVAAGPCDIEV